MLVPMSWLRALLPTLGDTPGREVADALVRAGLEVERVERLGVDRLVVGRVLAFEPEPQKNGKTIRWCQVDTGEDEPRGIVCGAANFAVGDLVAVCLPGAVLPNGMEIAQRKTYGHVSDGMICSARELALGDDHDGILVLAAGEPGADASALLCLDDEVLDIAVTPDRGYQLSIRGVAREAASVLELTFDDPGSGAVPPLPAGHPVRIEDLTGCDRYVAVTVEALGEAATPEAMARRLSRAGMRPISLAVDVTNHVMLELGQPLHAFDADRLTGAIVVRRAAPGERLVTLDGVDRALDSGDLVIADDTGPIALAGVMGGAATEITATTTRVLLEAAHFAPVTVARTARRHKLPSEAARRFERAVDPALAPVAARAAARLLAELAGARISAQTDLDHRPAAVPIAMPADLPSRVGGRLVEATDVVRHLVAVGATVQLAGAEQDATDRDAPRHARLTVTPPPWRPDLVAPIDLVEEVLRLEGLDLLPSVLPLAPGGGGLTTRQRQLRAVSRALAAAGWVQVGTSPFTAPGAGRDSEPELAVRNPLSAQESVLRTSLLPGMAAAAGRNVARGRADVALFETGSVFRDRRGAPLPPAAPALRPSIEVLAALDASLPEQPLHAGWLITGAAEPPGWWGPGRPADWTDAVAAAQAVARSVGLELTVASAATHPWHPGRCAALLLGGAVVGHAGELHPDATLAWGLPAGSCAGEVDLGPLLAAAGAVVAAPRPSTYPPSAVEVALVVGPAVGAAAVEAALRAGAGPLLESVGLLNVYVGPPIPAGDRSLAYRLRFRAPDRTLSGEEVNVLRDAAVAAAAATTGASLRA
jgi:phenylalanyl-tRNA synthetase beta chain